MSVSGEDEMSRFLARDHWLSQITRETVAAALKDFALPLQNGREVDWLALAVRRALAISIRSRGDGPERTSSADIKHELERLAELARGTWNEFFECDVTVDHRLWTVAWRNWDGEGGQSVGGLMLGEPSDYRRFKAAVGELDWLARFVAQAAKETAPPRGSWRSFERKALRIERGQYLAPVFEAAFGQEVSANNWHSDARQKKPTPFIEFYLILVGLAFQEKATPDISDVLKTACRRHREQPAQFGEGLIPGL